MLPNDLSDHPIQGMSLQLVDAAPELLMSEATRFFNEHKGAVLAVLVAGMAAANGSRKL